MSVVDAQSRPDWAVWDLHGDPDTIVEAADALRRRIASGVLLAPPGELVLLGVARLLDAVAHALHRGPGVDHRVVAGAMDIARYLTSQLVGPEQRSPPSSNR